MDEKLVGLRVKMIQNHQQLTVMRDALKNKSDKYRELRIEIMMDLISDLIVDLSAFVIVSTESDVRE